MASLRAQGILAALLAAVTFGAVNVAVRHAIEDGLQPLWAVAFSYAAGGLVLSPWLRKDRLAPAERPRMALVVAAGAVAGPLFLFFGLARTAAGTASLVMNLEMAFTALFAFLFLGERLRGGDLAGVALLALAALVASLAAGSAEGSTLLGVLLVGAAALSWAIDNAASTPLAQKHDPRGLIARKTGFGGLIVILAALVLAGPPGGAPLDWALAAGAGLVGVAASSVLFYGALARIGAARTTALFATGALWGVLFATLFLGEAFTPFHAAAAALSGLGIFALSRGASTTLK